LKTRIQFSPAADRTFSVLPKRARDRFNAAFAVLEEEGVRRLPGLDVRQMRNYRNVWRIRIGDYRGVFRLDGDEIRFVKFGHRRTIYHGIREAARE
jgi:mRNA-degrading endonuclease RelE of RelBE toxin-antitoxin system